MTFRWTASRDRELRRWRHLAVREAARALGCDAGDVILRRVELTTRAKPAGHRNGRVSVPQPLPRPVDPYAPTRPLIDLSHAPSGMEAMAAKWKAGAQ